MVVRRTNTQLAVTKRRPHTHQAATKLCPKPTRLPLTTTGAHAPSRSSSETGGRRAIRRAPCAQTRRLVVVQTPAGVAVGVPESGRVRRPSRTMACTRLTPFSGSVQFTRRAHRRAVGSAEHGGGNANGGGRTRDGPDAGASGPAGGRRAACAVRAPPCRRRVLCMAACVCVSRDARVASSSDASKRIVMRHKHTHSYC